MSIKKLNANVPLPNEPMPEVYQSTKVLQDVKLSKPRPKSKLREMKSMKILKNKVKLDEQINDFVNKENVKINDQNKEDYYLNTVVLTEVMQAAEKFFIYGSVAEREAMKYEAIYLLMTNFFNNDEDVLNRFKEINFKKIRKYGFIRRLLARIWRRISKKKTCR